ncbi:hypothetical protein CPLU01_09307 [Colletotrichum plurivorum]|uniref:Uncharacterized protein n=1 Tax=Colletotrichum plurivorum TaxID=2175906 RepID=A0A8H6NBR2_9PEZI|nr:hypothetical protein CPLU01_09307 [Colletotrichum plurivorum]
MSSARVAPTGPKVVCPSSPYLAARIAVTVIYFLLPNSNRLACLILATPFSAFSQRASPGILFRPSVCPTVLHPPPKLSLIAIPYLPRPVRRETFPVMSQRYEVSDSLLDGGQSDRPPSAGAEITGWETCVSKTLPIQFSFPLPAQAGRNLAIFTAGNLHGMWKGASAPPASVATHFRGSLGGSSRSDCPCVLWFSLPVQADTGAGLARDRGEVRDPKSGTNGRDGDLDAAPFKARGNVAATWLCFLHEDSSISVHAPRPYGVLAQPRCSAAARTGNPDADRDDRRRKGEELIQDFSVSSGEGRLADDSAAQMVRADQTHQHPLLEGAYRRATGISCSTTLHDDRGCAFQDRTDFAKIKRRQAVATSDDMTPGVRSDG